MKTSAETNDIIFKAMSPKGDLKQIGETTYRYALLTGPRTGSWLLSKMLSETGLAGKPLEYLNIRNIRAHIAIQGINNNNNNNNNNYIDIHQYLADMERRRTTPNGRFGLKLHWNQFLHVFGTRKGIKPEGIDFLRNMDSLVRLYRKDKLSQAISLYIASQTDVWASSDNSSKAGQVDGKTEPPFSPEAITNQLQSVIWQDEMWKFFLDRHNLAYQTISYEDLVEDYEGISAEVLSWLDLDTSGISVPEQQITKQRNELNETFRTRYIEYIGANNL